MVGEGRKGTDVGRERKDGGGGAVVEWGGQMYACVIFDEHRMCRHTLAGGAARAVTLQRCVRAADQRSFEGYLEPKVSHKHDGGFRDRKSVV